MKLSALLFIVFVFTFAQQANAQDKWQIADEATLRLKPAAFSQLPKKLFCICKSEIVLCRKLSAILRRTMLFAVSLPEGGNSTG
jgi:hypothetical protein